jgi:hypothetical protein
MAKFRSLIEVGALPELPLDAPAGLEASREAELPLELPEVLRREA